MKKALVLLLLAGMLVPACGKKEEQAPLVEPIPAQEREAPEAEDPVKAFDDAFGVSYTFDKSVRNDTTGRWRMMRFSATGDFTKYAALYYAAYFESDDEVHAVVNLQNCTYMLTCSGGTLYIDQHAYVDKEEHDAKVLGGGELLAQYTVDLKTGEVTKL